MNKVRRGRGPGARRTLLLALLALWALLLLAQALGRHHQIVHAAPAAGARHGAAHLHSAAGPGDAHEHGHEHGHEHEHGHGDTAYAVGWAEVWSGLHQPGDASCRLADAACGADATAPPPVVPNDAAGPVEPPWPAAQPPLREHGAALRQARGPPGPTAPLRG